MCLIALAWRARADLPLVVAANRDEWRERPAEPAHWWPDHPAILAGRDLQAGGTWMGVARGGRFAAVTNFRDPSDKRSDAKSRGGLVSEFLLGDEPPERFLASLAPRSGDYNGFNLILGDGEARRIEPGIHALSNHLLNEPWPKVLRGREAMADALKHRDPSSRLFDLLSDPAGAADEALPNTGVGVAWERRLASPLITGEDYGTRCSTVVLFSGDGEMRFEERTRAADGSITGVVAIREHLALTRA